VLNYVSVHVVTIVNGTAYSLLVTLLEIQNLQGHSVS
jgi:hypothetical protein